MFKLAYCDKIADTIRKALVKYDDDGILNGPVGKINWDLHPEGGYLVTTKKSINVWDSNGKAYVVTVEEAPVLDIDFEDTGKKEVDTV